MPSACLPAFLTLIGRACRVMSGDKSFAAFGRHLCRPCPPLSLSLVVRRRGGTTLFPQERQHNTLARSRWLARSTLLAHSFIPPLGVVRPTGRQTSPRSASLGRRRRRRRRPDHRRSTTTTVVYGLLPFVLTSSFLPPPPPSRFPPKFGRRTTFSPLSTRPWQRLKEGGKEGHGKTTESCE